MSRNRWSSPLVIGAAAALVACHTITEQAPSEPTPVTLTPIAIPVIMPTPKPTPAPTPNPNPTPTPAPTPTPSSPPPSGSCSLPPSNPPNPACTDETPRLLGQVESAITRATENKPEYFDFNNKKCDNCYYVKNVDGYVSQVIKGLNAQGVCALWDGEELAVKKTNDYSEQYDILLASGHIRRGAGSYQGICRPSWF
jgi:hypothetical protein